MKSTASNSLSKRRRKHKKSRILAVKKDSELFNKKVTTEYDLDDDFDIGRRIESKITQKRETGQKIRIRASKTRLRISQDQRILATCKSNDFGFENIALAIPA